ncbi:lipoate--protein ligase family protein [Kineococcus rubinsiae]|uniref:lipoate--protein ligase family protein n=1 Tax=Kineococcus rubinsiae TaxID=2609562 RepID=UPI00142FF576|nr:lipoate--protein ligase family protein [Kineococcus rubinsiae]NIZ91278.1 lipoate--protein ligase family protein [Kineococcus rubinsiae]
MHGEYKVPGGKLVVVDLEVVDGRLADVRLSGDFFLEPDEALEAVDAALQGVPADTDAGELAARVRSALPPGAVLLGFGPEAVATTVRRAVGGATGWRDHPWQFLHTAPQTPQLHMALDEVLAREVAEGRRPPTLRVWEWASSAVVIGSFQSLANEVDRAAADDFGVEVVRRISGGGAMFVEPGNTITYSVYAPASLVEGLSFQESYAFLDDWVLVALGDLGVKAWYQPINDIATEQGKIAGAAQKRLADGTVLHHVTMSYDIDAAKMLQVLRIGREKLTGKGLASAAKRVDPLRRQTGLARSEVIDRMVDTFRRQNGLEDSDLTPAEVAAAEALVASKFATPGWIARIP